MADLPAVLKKLDELVAEQSSRERTLREGLQQLRDLSDSLIGELGATAKRRTPAKPSPSKAEIATALAAARSSSPNASREELKDTVRTELRSQGFSLSGLALHLKNLL